MPVGHAGAYGVPRTSTCCSGTQFATPEVFDTVQTAFLDASERQERLVWWRTRVAVGLIFLLAIGAGVFGWESRRQALRADIERIRANERTREALEQRNQAL